MKTLIYYFFILVGYVAANYGIPAADSPPRPAAPVIRGRPGPIFYPVYDYESSESSEETPPKRKTCPLIQDRCTDEEEGISCSKLTINRKNEKNAILKCECGPNCKSLTLKDGDGTTLKIVTR